MAEKNMNAKISVEFEETANRQQLSSGDNLPTLFGKIKKFFTDLKTIAFSGSYNDLSDKPTTATTDTDGLMSSSDKNKLDSADDTYALKSKYGDTTIDVGRKANTPVGVYSTAEGYYTTASGGQSHAEGNSTIAGRDCSHAEGLYTIASGENQHVQGKYNISDTTSAHIVGNGTERNIRSNAHTLDWQGNAWFAGDVYTGSTSGTNKDDGSVKLPVVYSGTTAPTNDIGKNGDLYVLLDS